MWSIVAHVVGCRLGFFSRASVACEGLLLGSYASSIGPPKGVLKTFLNELGQWNMMHASIKN